MDKTCIRTGLLSLLIGMLACAPAWAANEGRAVGVDPDARADTRTLVVGSDVSVGERIVTGPSGQVQLVFLDNTRLVIGPGSSLVIESYLLRGGGSAERFTMNALGGTFRFVSGNSPKSAYQISTPSATIGVRGTAFDLVVGSGQTRVMLYEGALRVCAGNSCVDLEERCAVAATAGSVQLFPRSHPQRIELARSFRYAVVQSPLQQPFRVGGASNCLEAPAGGTSESISTIGTSGSEPDSRTSPDGNGSSQPSPGNNGQTPGGGSTTP